jgi:hypothetical protein
MARFARHSVLLLASILLGQGCRAPVQAVPPATAAALPGVVRLDITGPRSRANVMHHLAPMVEDMWRIYREHRARKPDLAGQIELQIEAAWNGEITVLEIARSTCGDPEFEEAVLHPAQFTDFDNWGRKGETAIRCVIEFR